jgi:hypothetical protein
MIGARCEVSRSRDVLLTIKSNGRRVSVHWFAGVLQSLCSPSKWRPLRLGEQRRKALELLTPPKPARSLRRRHSPRGANHVDGAAPEARLLRRGVAVVAAFIGFCSYSGTFCWAIPTRPLSLPRGRSRDVLPHLKSIQMVEGSGVHWFAGVLQSLCSPS